MLDVFMSLGPPQGFHQEKTETVIHCFFVFSKVDLDFHKQSSGNFMVTFLSKILGERLYPISEALNFTYLVF